MRFWIILLTTYSSNSPSGNYHSYTLVSSIGFLCSSLMGLHKASRFPRFTQNFYLGQLLFLQYSYLTLQCNPRELQPLPDLGSLPHKVTHCCRHCLCLQNDCNMLCLNTYHKQSLLSISNLRLHTFHKMITLFGHMIGGEFMLIYWYHWSLIDKPSSIG